MKKDNIRSVPRMYFQSGGSTVALEVRDESPEYNIEWAVIHRNADRARRRRRRGLVVMNPDPEPEHSDVSYH